MQVEDRIAALEERARALEAYVGFEPPRAERAVAAREPEPPPVLVETFPPPPPRVSAPRRPAVSLGDLEDLVGGRLLAWVGGLAVTLGVVFLLAIAVSRG